MCKSVLRTVFQTATLLSLAIKTFSQTATPLWQYTTGDAVLSSPALGTGVLYAGSYDQYLHAIKTSDGTELWKFSVKPAKTTQAGYIYSSPAIGSDGVIYFGTEERNFSGGGGNSGTFYAVNSNGTIKWKFPLTQAIYSDPAIGPDGTIYFGCFDTNFYALNPNGTLKWKFQTGSSIFSDPVVAPDGTIYFGCDDHKLYALSPTGTEKWTFDTGGAITASPAIGADGTIYVGTTTSMKFFAIHPDGTLKWEFQTGERIYSSAAIAPDSSIVFGSNDGNLYSLHPDGTLNWSFPANALVRSSPAIAADGTIYAGTDDGNFYALHSDGTLAWNFTSGDYVYSSPVIGPDGRVYVGSADHQVYAFAGSSTLATTAWPMFRHDPRHTGVATAAVVDNPPTITSIGDQSIAENTNTGALAFTVNDTETPAADLTLSGASSAQALVPDANIVFGGSGSTRTVTVTPAPNQAGSATITITVRDAGGNTAQTSFLLAVGSVNHAPSLDAISDQTVSEGSLLTFTAHASDSDTPAQTLTFSLSSAPPGATIDPATGVFTWTPTEEQGPGSYALTVVVTDNGSPALSASRTFNVTVNEVNSAPALDAIPDQTVNEGATLNFTAHATDSDLPAQTLTYSLSSAPTGAAIDPNTGVFSWIPTEAQGPGTYPVTVVATDNGPGALTASRTFNVTVAEVNSAPQFTPISDQTVQQGSTVTLTVQASDPDLPVNHLTYKLLSPPTGASIDSSTGVFTWTPTADQANTTSTITVEVTDDGVPTMSAQTTFKVTVTSGNSPAPVITSIQLTAGQVTITWDAVAGKSYRVEYTSNLPGGWTALAGDVQAQGPTASKQDMSATDAHRFYRVLLLP